MSHFYVQSGTLHQSPQRSKTSDGMTEVTLGFPVCKASEWVGDEAMETIALVMNQHDGLKAQNEWLKNRLAMLQLPQDQQHRRDEWLAEFDMPTIGGAA